MPDLGGGRRLRRRPETLLLFVFFSLLLSHSQQSPLSSTISSVTAHGRSRLMNTAGRTRCSSPPFGVSNLNHHHLSVLSASVVLHFFSIISEAHIVFEVRSKPSPMILTPFEHYHVSVFKVHRKILTIEDLVLSLFGYFRISCVSICSNLRKLMACLFSGCVDEDSTSGAFYSLYPKASLWRTQPSLTRKLYRQVAAFFTEFTVSAPLSSSRLDEPCKDWFCCLSRSIKDRVSTPAKLQIFFDLQRTAATSSCCLLGQTHPWIKGLGPISLKMLKGLIVLESMKTFTKLNLIRRPTTLNVAFICVWACISIWVFSRSCNVISPARLCRKEFRTKVFVSPSLMAKSFVLLDGLAVSLDRNFRCLHVVSDSFQLIMAGRTCSTNCQIFGFFPDFEYLALEFVSIFFTHVSWSKNVEANALAKNALLLTRVTPPLPRAG